MHDWHSTKPRPRSQAINDGVTRPDYFSDPGSDRLDNLTEYFLGTRPFIPDVPSDYIFGGIDPSAPLGLELRLFLQINRNHVAPDVVATAKLSFDLVDWCNEEAGALVSSINSPGVLQWFAIRSLDDRDRQFFRLNLE